MVSVSGSTGGSESGAKVWEKTLTDMNNIDEAFANARDLGYTRLNYSRLTSIGNLSKFDSVDIYKTQVQSNGKLAISLRDATEDEQVLDLSKYEQKLNELKQQLDPEGYKKEQAEKKAKEDENLLAMTAANLNIQVYAVKNGREVLVGDSTAEKGSKTREAMDSILQGEYKATKGDYYIKITRNEDNVGKNEEVPYALQLTMGGKFKHDYVLKEQVSTDTKNKTTSKIPMTQSGAGLSSVNALQIQASKYQTTAQMLQVGYMNMADIYNKTSKF